MHACRHSFHFASRGYFKKAPWCSIYLLSFWFRVFRQGAGKDDRVWRGYVNKSIRRSEPHCVDAGEKKADCSLLWYL